MGYNDTPHREKGQSLKLSKELWGHFYSWSDTMKMTHRTQHFSRLLKPGFCFSVKPTALVHPSGEVYSSYDAPWHNLSPNVTILYVVSTWITTNAIDLCLSYIQEVNKKEAAELQTKKKHTALVCVNTKQQKWQQTSINTSNWIICATRVVASLKNWIQWVCISKTLSFIDNFNVFWKHEGK